MDAFPKIRTLGDRYCRDILSTKVEITEKVDGSQFGFGRDMDGELFMRSKGRLIPRGDTDKQFGPVIELVESIEHSLPLGIWFYGEAVTRPRHNVLAYERTPDHKLALYGCHTGVWCSGDTAARILEGYTGLAIEPAPVLAMGTDFSPELVAGLLDQESFLGGCKIEGVVIKSFELAPHDGWCAKLVSDRFKEVAQRKVSGPKPWEAFKDSFRTEARWQKAQQHLAERAELEYENRDIGKLVAEVKRDIAEECKEDILEFLWNHHGRELLNASVGGIAEWYKGQLAYGAAIGEDA